MKDLRDISAGLSSATPPSQSLYDIVKPPADILMEAEDGAVLAVPIEPSKQGGQTRQDTGWGRRTEERENWVTVFGFPPSQIPYILLHFQNYGDIVRHVVPPGQCNWINIQYQTQLQAKKALSKNGKIIGDNLNLMVGVVECTDNMFTYARDDTSKGYPSLGFPRPLHPPPQRQPTRAYKVDIFDSKRAPSVHNSVWAKFLEYVLGA